MIVPIPGLSARDNLILEIADFATAVEGHIILCSSPVNIYTIGTTDSSSLLQTLCNLQQEVRCMLEIFVKTCLVCIMNALTDSEQMSVLTLPCPSLPPSLPVLQVERELQEVEALIRQSEPMVKQVATKINSLLQLC